MKLRFHAELNCDFDLARDWLEDQRSGLGDEFTYEFNRVLDSIRHNPMQFSPAPGSRHEEGFRICLMKTFNYCVVFRVFTDPQEVIVLLLQHGHRRPGGWRAWSKSID